MCWQRNKRVMLVTDCISCRDTLCYPGLHFHAPETTSRFPPLRCRSIYFGHLGFQGAVTCLADTGGPPLSPPPVFSSSPIRRWIEEYWRIFGYFVRNGLHFLFFFDFYIYVCVLFFSFFKLFILCERIYSWKSRKINFLIFFSDISRYLPRYVHMTGPLKERRRIHINIIGYK